RPIAQERSGNMSIVVVDAIGTPTELVSRDGRISWRAQYRTWGQRTSESDASDTCPIRFQGQYEDVETGLHYNRFRYYDPTTALYLSPDPLGLAGGLQPLSYVSNPTRWVDPLGLIQICSSAGRMQMEVRRGQAPRDVVRVDSPHIPGQEPHVHYKDGTSSNQSGSTHDQHKGTPNPPKKTRKWLEGHGWTPPPKGG
ncbi:MAG TPA: hypothetical protein ENJ18_07030, partial [Nannocystis exedens]|nr:hypothetical protein [Nannocystis exedens]